MTRRRLAIAAIAAAAAAGTFGATSATAATADQGVRLQASDPDYIACAGLRIVPVATCIEDPVTPLLDLVPIR